MSNFEIQWKESAQSMTALEDALVTAMILLGYRQLMSIHDELVFVLDDTEKNELLRGLTSGKEERSEEGQT